jgi:glyoxylase-like metal-dependent hydrolase (beta-lactamase superfamily II)
VSAPSDPGAAVESGDTGTFAYDFGDPDPLLSHRLGEDPLTTRATQVLPVGGRALLALSDGFFTIDGMPAFLGSPADPHGLHDQLAAAGMTPPRMPVGAFLWPGEQNVLVDAGFGPRSGGGGLIVGGELPRNMAKHGLGFADIDVVALSHLHPDHTGWVAHPDGSPVFPRARLVIGRRDWDYFVDGDEADMQIEDHLRCALNDLAERSQVDLIDGEVQLAPGLTRLDGSGHTPGHSLYLVENGGERALLFGDAMYCPQQLTEVDWEASSDVDPAAAKRTRERYLRELDDEGGWALGCHFPGLRAGRVLNGTWLSN